jgi:hypothetical protein
VLPPPPQTQVATPEQAQEVHAYLRSVLSDRLGRNPAENVRIIYGGSVNDGNCNELATQVLGYSARGGGLACVRGLPVAVGGLVVGKAGAR